MTNGMIKKKYEAPKRYSTPAPKPQQANTTSQITPSAHLEHHLADASFGEFSSNRRDKTQAATTE